MLTNTRNTKNKTPFLILLVIETQSYEKKKQKVICLKAKRQILPPSVKFAFSHIYFDSTFYLLS